MRGAFSLRLLIAGAFLAAAIVVPTAGAQRAAAPTMVVNFDVNGTVTVSVNGAPLGTTSGAPTVIPGGYYSVLLNGPGDCINLPLFELSGPGVDIQDDMLGGEVDTHSLPTYFAPNSTFSWHIDRAQSIVYTFTTSAASVGSASIMTAPTGASGKGGGATSNDIVGSAIVPSRGVLAGTVTPSGRVTVAYRGKSVSSLKPGRYTVTVVDKSPSGGFVVKGKSNTATVTGSAFVGKRSMTLNLTAGHWAFGPSAAKSTLSVSVG